MHTFSLPQSAIDGVTARLGRAHAVERLDPARTALVVVDMQNYFMAPGQQLKTPAARAVVPNVNALAAALRAAGGPVVWIHNVAPRNARERWPSYEELHLPEQWAIRQRSLTPGDVGHDIWPDLEQRDGDLHVTKSRFSAFIQGASDLDAQLRTRGIDTLLIAGVATNICCESTARDAMMLNYRVVMVSDGCAAPSDALHAAALINFYRFFGDVHATRDLVDMLEAARAPRRATA